MLVSAQKDGPIIDKRTLKLRASLGLELRYQPTPEGTLEQFPLW
jgi:hypothetical protein